MQLTARFAAIASAVVLACTSVSALSIRVDSGNGLREVLVREPVEKAVFEYKAEDKELMAPHDVELVRRVTWRYNDTSKQCHVFLRPSDG